MNPKSPKAVDIEVGHTIRALRRSRGMTQTDLADRIGVTFQQIQKYEKGSNRVCASNLVLIAEALGVAPADLLPAPKAKPGPSLLEKVMAERDVLAAKLAHINSVSGTLLAQPHLPKA